MTCTLDPLQDLVGMRILMLSLPLTKSGMHISRFMKRLLSGDINRFSWFNDLCIIFGKDRATGHDAQTAADMLEELDKEYANLQGAEDGLQDFNFDSSSMLHGANSDESTSKRSSKKRSRSMDPVAEAVYNA